MIKTRKDVRQFFFYARTMPSSAIQLGIVRGEDDKFSEQLFIDTSLQVADLDEALDLALHWVTWITGEEDKPGMI